jgi:hypothetical protein
MMKPAIKKDTARSFPAPLGILSKPVERGAGLVDHGGVEDPGRLLGSGLVEHSKLAVA